MKTNAIGNDFELFGHRTHLRYIALMVLAAAVVQTLIVIAFFWFNAIDI